MKPVHLCLIFTPSKRRGGGGGGGRGGEEGEEGERKKGRGDWNVNSLFLRVSLKTDEKEGLHYIRNAF